MDLAIRHDILRRLNPGGQDGIAELFNRVTHWHNFSKIAAGNGPAAKLLRMEFRRSDRRPPMWLASSEAPSRGYLVSARRRTRPIWRPTQSGHPASFSVDQGPCESCSSWSCSGPEASHLHR